MKTPPAHLKGDELSTCPTRSGHFVCGIVVFVPCRFQHLEDVRDSHIEAAQADYTISEEVSFR